MELTVELENVEIVEVKCRAWLRYGDVKIPAEFTLKQEDFEHSEIFRGFNLMFLPRGGLLDPEAIEKRVALIESVKIDSLGE